MASGTSVPRAAEASENSLVEHEVKFIKKPEQKDGYQNMVYANVQFNDGRLADGQKLDNVYTIGLRWELGKIVDWMKDS